jgi:hypothetical protein
MGNRPKPKGTAARTGRAAGATSSTSRRWVKPVVAVLAVGTLGLFVWWVASDVASNPQGPADPPPGTEYFVVTDISHTTDPVIYDQDPPVGGAHHPQWLQCRAYDQPVPNEMAVHTLEHGAVWIAYRPDLDPADVRTLEGFTSRSKVLVSPYPGLDDPVVLTAWATQLRLDAVDTDLIDQFYRAFVSRTAPEPAGAC